MNEISSRIKVVEYLHFTSAIPRKRLMHGRHAPKSLWYGIGVKPNASDGLIPLDPVLDKIPASNTGRVRSVLMEAKDKYWIFDEPLHGKCMVVEMQMLML